MRGKAGGAMTADYSPIAPDSAGKPARQGRAVRYATFACAVLAAAVVLAGALFGWRYYVTSVLLVTLSLVPFFVSFEGRKPQAREVVALAVMCALAVASRVVFIGLPSMKPLVGIVMIAGIAFGPQSGFLTGAIAALVSNFIFGQGPWTPWQMLAYGSAGLVAGALAKAGAIPRGGWTMWQRLAVSALGFALIVCLVGPILDTSSLLMMISVITPESAAAVYLSGLLAANIPHGLATFVTLFVVGSPLLKKLNRVQVKYGFRES